MPKVYRIVLEPGLYQIKLTDGDRPERPLAIAYATKGEAEEAIRMLKERDRLLERR
jgi:hypothetical protein